MGPKANFSVFVDKFWSICPAGQREDTQDRGAEYRSVVGIPGGLGGELASQLQTPAAGTLVDGNGNDPDTLNTRNVYVYDTAAFPVHVAEKYHQFHDDMVAHYGSA